MPEGEVRFYTRVAMSKMLGAIIRIVLKVTARKPGDSEVTLGKNARKIQIKKTLWGKN